MGQEHVSTTLANAIADRWVDRLTSFHKFWINVLLAMVALHVLAAVVYLVWKKQNLIGAMITGRKPLDDVVPPGKPAPNLFFAPGRLALSVLLAAAAVVYFIVRA